MVIYGKEGCSCVHVLIGCGIMIQEDGRTVALDQQEQSRDSPAKSTSGNCRK